MNLFLGVGAISGGLAVAAGAFGAHALKTRLDEYSLGVFQTGASYQMYHALALLAVGLVPPDNRADLLRGAGWAFTIGTVLFSGSLYALALSGVRVLGAITPLGGVGFLVGWTLLALAAFR